jgi:hypothetical protein
VCLCAVAIFWISLFESIRYNKINTVPDVSVARASKRKKEPSVIHTFIYCRLRAGQDSKKQVRISRRNLCVP